MVNPKYAGDTSVAIVTYDGRKYNLLLGLPFQFPLFNAFERTVRIFQEMCTRGVPEIFSGINPQILHRYDHVNHIGVGLVQKAAENLEKGVEVDLEKLLE